LKSKERLDPINLDVCAADWKTPQDVKNHYSSASFLPDRVIIFNVKGNSYRLVVQCAFNTKHVVVKWVGTHAEYDKVYGGGK